LRNQTHFSASIIIIKITKIIIIIIIIVIKTYKERNPDSGRRTGWAPLLSRLTFRFFRDK